MNEAAQEDGRDQRARAGHRAENRTGKQGRRGREASLQLRPTLPRPEGGHGDLPQGEQSPGHQEQAGVDGLCLSSQQCVLSLEHQEGSTP